MRIPEGTRVCQFGIGAARHLELIHGEPLTPLVVGPMDPPHRDLADFVAGIVEAHYGNGNRDCREIFQFPASPVEQPVAD